MELTKEQIRKLKRAYLDQKAKAAIRKDRNGDPIDWQFTFDTWLQWWIDSGKLEQRGGYGNDYCMARIDDIGPYSPTNVTVKTMAENVSNRHEYWSHSEESKQKIREARAKQVFSEETRKKFTERNKRRWAKEKLKPKELVQCPHCTVSSYSKLIMYRHHFDNCKQKI